MTRFLSDKLFTAIAVPAFILALASPTLGQEPPQGFVKEGGYVGVAGLLDFTLDGNSFDGMTYYQEIGGDEILILPRLDKRNVIRPILGYRAKKAALEFSYERTSHDGTFGEATGDAIFQSFNVDGRYYFVTQSRIQPHILVGAAFPWLRVKDGSFLNEDVGDGRWRGYGINTEAGVTVYPTPQFGIAAGYHYRVMWFDRATGVTDTLFELRPRFRETAGSFIVTGLFTF